MTDSLREYRKLYNKTRSLALEYNIANVVPLNIIGWQDDDGGTHGIVDYDGTNNNIIWLSVSQKVVTGTPIIFTNTVASCVAGKTYYVINLFGSAPSPYFQISLTPTGNVIALDYIGTYPNTGIAYYNSSTYLMELKDVIAERVQMLRGLQWGSVGFLQDPSLVFGTETFVKSENKKLLKNFGDLMPKWGGPGNDMAHTGRSVYTNGNIGDLAQIFKVPGEDGSNVSTGLAIGTDGTIYFGTNGYFYAISPSGELVWWNTQEAGNSDYIGNPVLDTSGNIYVKYDDSDNLYKISKIGKRLSNINYLGYAPPAIGRDGTLYVMNNDNGSMIALNPDGTTKWNFVMNNYSVQPAIGYIDGVETLYVGTTSNDVYSVNASNGSQNWSYLTGGPINCAPVIGSNGIVYIGSNDDYVYALNGRDGSLLWKFQTGGDIKSLALGQNGHLYATSADHNIYALLGTYTSGTGLIWSANPGGSITTTPAQDSDGNIYVTSNGQVQKYNRVGDNLNTFITADLSSIQTSPIIDNGYLYVGTTTGIWRWLLSDNSYNNSLKGPVTSDPVCDGDGNVYYIVGNRMYASQSGLNGIHWEDPNYYTLFGSTSFYAPLKFNNNAIYVGSDDTGIMYGINTSGETVFQTLSYTEIYGSGAVFSGPYITFGSVDTNIYTIQPGVDLQINTVDASGFYNSDSITVSGTRTALDEVPPSSNTAGNGDAIHITTNINTAFTPKCGVLSINGSSDVIFAIEYNHDDSTSTIYVSNIEQFAANSVTDTVIIEYTGTSYDSQTGQVTGFLTDPPRVVFDCTLEQHYINPIIGYAESNNTGYDSGIVSIGNFGGGQFEVQVLSVSDGNGSFSLGDSVQINNTKTILDGNSYQINSMSDRSLLLVLGEIAGIPEPYVFPSIPLVQTKGITSGDSTGASIILGIPSDGTMFVYNSSVFGNTYISSIVGTMTDWDNNYYSDITVTINDGHKITFDTGNGGSSIYRNPYIGFVDNGTYGSLITSMSGDDNIVSSSGTGNVIITTPVIDPFTNNVFYSSFDGHVYKADSATNLDSNSAVNLSGSGIPYGLALSADGQYLYVGAGSTMNAIELHGGNDFGNGQRIFTYNTNDGIQCTPIVDPVNKNVYFGDTGGNFYSVKVGPDTRSPYWIHDFNPNNFGDTPGDMAIGGDGTVYVAVNRSNGAYMVALSQNGEEITQWAAPDGDNTMSSPVIGSGGTLYVASESGISAFN